MLLVSLYMKIDAYENNIMIRGATDFAVHVDPDKVSYLFSVFLKLHSKQSYICK